MKQTTFVFRKRKAAPRVPPEHRNEYKRLVRGYLRVNCIGRGNAQKSPQIRRMCALPPSQTEEIVREIIRELLEDGVCIGSCTKGYFIIENGDELADVIENLRQRQEGIETRIRLISEAYALEPGPGKSAGE